MTPPLATTRADFIAFMGRALEEHGFSPIAGRILGLLIFDGDPRSFSDLATELGVSRGSISANARHLVNRGTIEKVNRPGDRQDYFRITEQSFDVMLNGLCERMRATSASVREYARALPADEQGARKRLDGLADFHAAMAEGVSLAALSLTRQSGPGRSDSSDCQPELLVNASDAGGRSA
ncbi:MAG: GbsR/MarR family transcriptional regulator [Pararhodobacter sp.]